MPKTESIHTIYKTADGQRVPSVTTYLNILAKPALIHWSWELGTQGLDYRKVKDQAGDIGTLVHYLILCDLQGKEPDLSDCSPNERRLVESSLSKYQVWKNGQVIEPILMETPLVSETYKFGGTPDFYGKIDDKLTLLDFKTGKAIYSEAFYQVSAYKKLLEEYGYGVEQVKVLRIGKSDDEGFEERSVGNLDKHWELFLCCQKIYNLQKDIRRAD